MRLARFASLVALVLLAGGVCTAAGAVTHRAQISASGDAKYPSWTVTAWGKTPQDGNEVALDKALKEVESYLARQDPPVHWKPSRDWVDRNLVKTRHQEVKVLNDEDLGDGYDVTLKVEVGPKQYREILERDREERVKQRDLLLARILAGVVALLVAVVGYLRLDEATKGYYTLWLRLGALGLVGAVAFVLIHGWRCGPP
jgi:hypothetical protein